MLTGDREPNASVVAVATPDVENGKRRRSCSRLSLFLFRFSDTCSASCLSKCVADCQSLFLLLVVTEVAVNRKRESCSSFECVSLININKMQ